MREDETLIQIQKCVKDLLEFFTLNEINPNVGTNAMFSLICRQLMNEKLSKKEFLRNVNKAANNYAKAYWGE